MKAACVVLGAIAGILAIVIIITIFLDLKKREPASAAAYAKAPNQPPQTFGRPQMPTAPQPAPQPAPRQQTFTAPQPAPRPQMTAAPQPVIPQTFTAPQTAPRPQMTAAPQPVIPQQSVYTQPRQTNVSPVLPDFFPSNGPVTPAMPDVHKPKSSR